MYTRSVLLHRICRRLQFHSLCCLFPANRLFYIRFLRWRRILIRVVLFGSGCFWCDRCLSGVAVIFFRFCRRLLLLLFLVFLFFLFDLFCRFRRLRLFCHNRFYRCLRRLRRIPFILCHNFCRRFFPCLIRQCRQDDYGPDNNGGTQNS